jgi:hypothetical protein
MNTLYPDFGSHPGCAPYKRGKKKGKISKRPAAGLLLKLPALKPREGDYCGGIDTHARCKDGDKMNKDLGMRNEDLAIRNRLELLG